MTGTKWDRAGRDTNFRGNAHRARTLPRLDEPLTIECMTAETAHLFGRGYLEMYRFQDRHFRLRQNYNVPTFAGLSWDNYDNPSSHYLLYRVIGGLVCGMSRLTPTTQQYMLGDLWPDMIDGPTPSAPNIWESSRLGVAAPGALRTRIVQHLLVAKIEWAKLNEVDTFVGVMPPALWRKVFTANGWPTEFLGAPKTLETGETIMAGRAHVSATIERAVRGTTGIRHRVLRTAPRTDL